MSNGKDLPVRPNEELVKSPSTNVRNIAVMGLTGTGKTTFINIASGAELQVGHGLSSCTQDIQIAPAFKIKLNNRTVNLIDTPGFDDTDRSEVQILKTIASYLKEQYSSDIKLHGVIYLHNIDANRMGGISNRAFALFKKLCGTDNLSNVSIVTTKWDRVEVQEGENREKELSAKYFKTALENGAKLFRHNGTKESANNLLHTFLVNAAVTLLLQKELVDDLKPVFDTEAGIHVENDLKNLIERAKKEENKGGSRDSSKLEQYLRDEDEIRSIRSLGRTLSAWMPDLPTASAPRKGELSQDPSFRVASSLEQKPLARLRKPGDAPPLGKTPPAEPSSPLVEDQMAYTESPVSTQLQNPDWSVGSPFGGTSSGIANPAEKITGPVRRVRYLPSRTVEHLQTTSAGRRGGLGTEGSQGTKPITLPKEHRRNSDDQDIRSEDSSTNAGGRVALDVSTSNNLPPFLSPLHGNSVTAPEEIARQPVGYNWQHGRSASYLRLVEKDFGISVL